MLYDFANIVVFLVLTGVLVFGTLLVGRLVRTQKPTPEKNTIYECGEPPFGSSWVRYNIRFYNIALVFLIFDVEVVCLFPVILVLQHFKLISRTLMLVAVGEVAFFVVVLVIALIYAWHKGALDWLRAPESPYSVEESHNPE
ncbi:NADH-quinone oxidoreductase subunit A [Candidatus Sumerlaeota bacterium]|nr:NADH-quinone oxidoreductase subunit A [Candidatus Sumerlaeota bacterium]